MTPISKQTIAVVGIGANLNCQKGQRQNHTDGAIDFIG